MIPRAFFERDPLTVAEALIGCEFVHGACHGIVIETEAYHEIGDEACHTFLRPSARAFIDSHPAGTAYVYLNYGVHWLANVVCHDLATGGRGFVLLRALEPVKGTDTMRKRRGRDKVRDLCSGPGKLTRALGIDGSFHGRSLTDDPAFCFRPRAAETGPELVFDRRVGISQAKELPWRVLVAGHPGVSVPFGKVK